MMFLISYKVSLIRTPSASAEGIDYPFFTINYFKLLVIIDFSFATGTNSELKSFLFRTLH